MARAGVASSAVSTEAAMERIAAMASGRSRAPAVPGRGKRGVMARAITRAPAISGARTSIDARTTASA